VWSAKSEIADLYLSGRTLATRANDKVLLHPLVEDDWLRSLQAGLSEWPKRRWRIWLGGHRCGLHLCEPIAGVRSVEEAEAALGASLSAEGRAVSVRLATWSIASRPWLALATEAGLVDGLMSVVAGSAGHVHSLRPWWTMVKGGDLSDAAMCDDETITYWRQGEPGTFSAAATLWSVREQQPATLQRLRIGGALAARRLEMEVPSERTKGFMVSLFNEM
jgi:hypothetical protein